MEQSKQHVTSNPKNYTLHQETISGEHCDQVMKVSNLTSLRVDDQMKKLT